jgi:hypothetical protein
MRNGLLWGAKTPVVVRLIRYMKRYPAGPQTVRLHCSMEKLMQDLTSDIKGSLKTRKRVGIKCGSPPKHPQEIAFEDFRCTDTQT